MKKENLNRMLEQVDDDLLQESMTTVKKGAFRRWNGTAVAAALAVVLGASIGMNAWLHTLSVDGGANAGSEAYIGALESTTETTAGTVAEGATESSSAMTGQYWVPEHNVAGEDMVVGNYEASVGGSISHTPLVGEVIISPALEQAMRDYETSDPAFMVAMDVFGPDAVLTADELAQEADALADDGYCVLELGDQIILQMLAEEIKNFTAVREYGYCLWSAPLPMIGEGSASSESPSIDTTEETTNIPVVYGSTLPECNCGEDAVQPTNGEVKIDHRLLHGMELHEGTQARFFVAAELYKDGELLTGEDALYPLILAVKSALWNTRSLGGPEEISFLAEATAEQIESFEAPEGYAVVLRFAREHEENDGVVASFWWE